MLNDWSDRTPPTKQKARRASGEFWVGVAAVMAGLTLLVAFFV